MKEFKYILISILSVGIITSCNFLDKEPYKITPETYFQNEEQANSYLTGIYAIIGQSSFYGGDYMLLAGGDDLTCYAGSTGRVSTSGLICNLATTSDPAVTALWFTLYNGIERANYFIEQIDKMTNISNSAREQYKSEARFLRAFYYFNLVQNWGDVPFKTESTMSTESLNNKDIPRTPKDDIYKFIVDEMSAVADEETGGLKSASDLGYLPGRVSKSAAWGMLARVYMFWAGEHYRDNKAEPADKIEKFSKALEYAKKVLGEGHQLSDKYWDIFIDMCSDKYDTSKKHESIWEAEFAGDGTGDVRAEGRIGNTNGIQAPDFSSKTDIVGKNDPGYAYAFLWATPKLYDLYGYVMPYGKNLNGVEPTWEGIGNGGKIVRDDRFIWNIAPFSYRRSTVSEDDNNSKAPKGVVGRTFECKDLYWWVMSKFDEDPKHAGYGPESYEYGFSDEVYDSKKHNEGDFYKTTPANLTTRDGLARDLCAAKFRREYEPATKKNKNNTSINFPIMRYSDVLLMIAEAENEVNGRPTQEALDKINEVRTRAGICKLQELEDYQDNQDYFRNAIKDERAREFCFEFTRRYDLIRWGDYIENMHNLVSETGEKYWRWGLQVASFFNIPESYNYFPIPESEMSVNKLIKTNNPGW